MDHRLRTATHGRLPDMSENQNPAPGSPADPAQPAAETAPLAPPAATAAPADPLPAAGPVPTKVRWRDRAYGLRSVLAVALAGLVVGAGAGVGTALLVDDDHGDRPGRHWLEEGPGRRGDFPGWRDGGRGFPPPQPGRPGQQDQQQAPQQDQSEGATS